ncbi:hypothetical protein KC957_00900 [Candidatus Saccharibacteria bacterium]|nr:hypothetical protein [Candidatus Saccharibacteria bacterium]
MFDYATLSFRDARTEADDTKLHGWLSCALIGLGVGSVVGLVEYVERMNKPLAPEQEDHRDNR